MCFNLPRSFRRGERMACPPKKTEFQHTEKRKRKENIWLYYPIVINNFRLSVIHSQLIHIQLTMRCTHTHTRTLSFAPWLWRFYRHNIMMSERSSNGKKTWQKNTEKKNTGDTMHIKGIIYCDTHNMWLLSNNFNYTIRHYRLLESMARLSLSSNMHRRKGPSSFTVCAPNNWNSTICLSSIISIAASSSITTTMANAKRKRKRCAHSIIILKIDKTNIREDHKDE